MFKLIVKSISDEEKSEAFERTFDQDAIKIGRRESNDLPLRDPRRLISGSHAEIRRRDGGWMLVDVGSKNGTRLNGEPLTSGKEYPLEREDEIAIGSFVIQFYPVVSSEAPPPSTEKETAPTLVSDVVEQAQELISDLNQVYWDHAKSEHSERISLMAGVLRRGIEGLDPGSAHKILGLIKARFPDPDYQQKQVLLSTPNLPSASQTEESKVSQAAYQGVLSIARKYFDGESVLKSKETVEQFLHRIDQTLASMVDYLANAVKGRSEFEQEFDVESTRIFSWKPNPIKMAAGGKEIGAYLLNWKKKEGEKAASDLNEVLTDLALHQMGMIAGFRECLRGLLQKMNPREIEADVLASPLKLGPLKIPRFAPLVHREAWRRYRKKHQELLEEEVKTFETILGPHFSKGYLSIQKKKKTP